MNSHQQFIGLLRSYLDKTISDSDRNQFLYMAATGVYDDDLSKQMELDIDQGFSEEADDISTNITEKMWKISIGPHSQEFLFAINK